MSNELKHILEHFDVDISPAAYGNGHINDTFLVDTNPGYILQRINTNVFKNPEGVMSNIKAVTEHLRKKIIAAGGNPERETLNIINTVDGKPYYKDTDGSYYRMYLFVTGAKSYDIVENPRQLYSAAKAFGNFQNLLADFPADELFETIPNFHNTVSRYNDFKKFIEKNASGRADSVKEEIKFVLDREADASVVVNDIAEGKIPLRVTHNDTKLNNVLLDDVTGEGICVIDLDTVMPGSLLYDYGDALRFGGSSGAEDEEDLSKIYFKLENFEAFTRGFLEALPSITERELELLPFSIKLMTLECGSRFLADYVDGDNYFKVHKDNHNLIRARTQFKLVKDIEENMDEMNAIVRKIYNEVH